MKTCFPVLIFSCLLNAFAGSAQTDSLAIKKDSTKANRHSFVKAGLGFVSDNIYLGRKDIATQSGIVPSLGYYHKSGLFVAAAASYIPNTGYQRVDMKMISAGFEHDGEKFSWSAAISKYAFNDSSNAINSSISTMADLYASYDLDLITMATGINFSFAKNTDIVINPAISHPFYFYNDRLSFGPEINLFAGTENFFEEYYNANGNGHSAASRGRGHAHNNSGSSNEKVSVLSYNKFKIMDYEFGVPIEFTKKHFIFELKPSYIIPVNPATLIENNVTVKEGLKNSFLLETRISFKFGKTI